MSLKNNSVLTVYMHFPWYLGTKELASIDCVHLWSYVWRVDDLLLGLAQHY